MGKKTQHYLNPLHVYCRMRDLGITIKIATFLGRIYERLYNLFIKHPEA